MKLPAQPPSSSPPEAGAGVAPDPDLRQAFRADKAAQIEKYRASGKIDTLMRGLSRNADRTLSAIWHDCHLPGGLTLVAVGGYGRGELAPHSDIDILVLLPVEPDESLTGRLERFIGCAWDLGLDVGSSVRTI
ncbi:MAG: nucleotidyltransferase domain-containing protein, partial [Janthinobacterium lividum]